MSRGELRTAVVTSRRGGAGSGLSSAATSIASCLESPKKRGRTSSLFSFVTTLATSTSVVKQSRPSRIGATISGILCTSSAAVLRYWAAALDRRSSRCRNQKRLEYPSSVHSRRASKSARATRKSARTACSRASRSASRAVSSRAFVMLRLSHVFSEPRQTHEDARSEVKRRRGASVYRGRARARQRACSAAIEAFGGTALHCERIHSRSRQGLHSWANGCDACALPKVVSGARNTGGRERPLRAGPARPRGGSRTDDDRGSPSEGEHARTPDLTDAITITLFFAATRS